jgi:hypothetical protein
VRFTCSTENRDATSSLNNLYLELRSMEGAQCVMEECIDSEKYDELWRRDFKLIYRLQN